MWYLHPRKNGTGGEMLEVEERLEQMFWRAAEKVHI